MSLSQVAKALKGQQSGADVHFQHVCIDSRCAAAGDLFVAIKGDNFDGHAFVDQAISNGACGAVVEQLQQHAANQIVVPDAIEALGELGALNRAAFKGKVIGLTGSVGKTTTKDMLSSILSRTGGVLATQGNRNNEIGLPLTLLDLAPQHQFAVLEMGAAQLGDINYLTRLARPDVALVTRVVAAHLEGFGSLENIAKTKGEIFAGLTDDGVAVINLDCPFAAGWLAGLKQQRLVRFSISDAASDVYASELQLQTNQHWSFRLHTPVGDAPVELPVLGAHNITNAIAAAGVAVAVGIELSDICEGLQNFVSTGQRMQVRKGLHGAVLIDDSYNANPDSVKAALDVLAAYPGARFFIFGDMAELGENAEKLHTEIGEYVRARGIEQFVTVGKLSAFAARAYGESARAFDDRNAAAEYCATLLSGDHVALVKGSRSAGMEHLVASLCADGEVS
ncbi:MAG: UDP-N-acetylmuramoyl-tripeptide--D-alanyl-D-alanine ligase [Pseudomonadales bacterium]